ncbi:MAG: GWxTD domain-containing protein [Gemmatimonadaceae bacterium]|nr:GWxTD domain-containing protein [Gemmatimonadaceae bacterium]
MSFPGLSALRPTSRLAALGALTLLSACGGGPPGGAAAPGGAPAPTGGDLSRRGDLAFQSDPVRIWQSMGLLASGQPIPIVAGISFLPGPVADTAYALVAISIPSIAMTFTREGDRYAGGYEVIVEARRGETVIARVDAKETVRVAAFRETQRTEESVVFQQVVPIPAGDAIVALQLRDAGSPRSVTMEKAVVVPRFTAGRLGSPVVALEAEPRTTRAAPPAVTASPRQTLQFGSDEAIPLYLEMADAPAGDLPVQLLVRTAEGSVLWRDSTRLTKRGTIASDVVRVPLPRIGVGLLNAIAWTPGSTDSVRTAVLVNFGDDLPVASLDEMVSYLRFFAPARTLTELRNPDPGKRAEAWLAFLRSTDPIGSTPQHEGLRDYFRRIRFANERFREDAAAGWLSDRGSAYVAFGEPDQVLDQGGMVNNNIGQRGRMQAWDYVDLRLRLIFVDQNGFGRWRFTVQSAGDFDSALRRRLNP